MSDHDHDPLDRAWAEAETALGDDEASAARRARVLDAVAEDKAAPALMRGWRPDWRRDRWLAAACVAGFGLFVAFQLYKPLSPLQPPPRAAPSQPASVAGAPRLNQPVAQKAAPQLQQRIAPPVAPPPPVPAPAPQMKVAAAPQAFPAQSSVQEVVVTGGRALEEDRAGISSKNVARQALAAKPEDRADAAPAPPPPPPPPPPSASPAPEAPSSGLVAKLAAAAVAGRTSEVEALLEQGAPVDAVDAQGNTALMRSILADRPAVAALLHRRGASLDLKNHAGRSARDMALDADDAKLRSVLGISR